MTESRDTTADSRQDKIHYSWQLHNADGDWQAGGDASSFYDVIREGKHYLQIFLSDTDKPHKLIIQRHSVRTIALIEIEEQS
jgi:hypothetical protein